MTTIVATGSVTASPTRSVMAGEWITVVDGVAAMSVGACSIVGRGSINPSRSALCEGFSVVGAVFNSRDNRYVLTIGATAIPIESFTIRRSTRDELTFNLPDGVDDFSARLVLERVVGGYSSELFSGWVTRYDKPKLVAVSDGATVTYSRTIEVDQIVYFSFSAGQIRARVVTHQAPRVGDTVIMDNMSYTVTGVTEYISLESELTELICA